jgi:hypothetical protein
MIQKGNAHVEALHREGASSEAVTGAYHDHVGALRRVMEQAEFSRAQIEALPHRYDLLAAAPDINKNVNVHTNYYSHNTPVQEEGRSYVGALQYMHQGGPGHGDVRGLSKASRACSPRARCGHWASVSVQAAGVATAHGPAAGP